MLPLVDSTTRAGRASCAVIGNGVLRPGMYARRAARGDAHSADGGSCRERAVIERDGRPLVFVVKDGRAEWVYINRGRDNGVETEVLPDTITERDPGEAGRPGASRRGHLTLTHEAPGPTSSGKADTP